MEDRPVVFAHISDTHFGPVPGYERHGFVPLPCAEKVVELLNALPFPLDFVVHTGDVATDPDDRSYELARATLGRLQAPVYYVVGNHDTARHIRRHLPMGPRDDLSDDPDLLSYAFEVRGRRFLSVDARAPDDLDPHGLLSSEQLAVLDRELNLPGAPLTVFCHFFPLTIGVPWMDRTMTILNGSMLHSRLVAVGPRLRGVFVGHVHQALCDYRDGVLYCAAPSAFAQLAGDPGDDEPRVDKVSPPGFQVVQVGHDQTIVRLHAFERP